VNKFRPLCIAFLILFLAPTLASAQSADAKALEDHMQTVRAKVVAKRDSALRTLLTMTDEQAKAFWPLQQAYDKELKQLGKTDRKLLSEFSEIYDKLDKQSAKDIADRFFDSARERLALQQRYFEQVSNEVSPVVAVLFIQLQRRFETELQMERMRYAPLAE